MLCCYQPSASPLPLFSEEQESHTGKKEVFFFILTYFDSIFFNLALFRPLSLALPLFFFSCKTSPSSLLSNAAHPSFTSTHVCIMFSINIFFFCQAEALSSSPSCLFSDAHIADLWNITGTLMMCECLSALALLLCVFMTQSVCGGALMSNKMWRSAEGTPGYVPPSVHAGSSTSSRG